jgi:hypothetical protein
MPDYTLVPVDHQPDFDDYSLVPVDYDPFAADRLAQPAQFQQPPTPTQPAQLQQAQAQPQGPPQQQPATGAGQPDAGAPAAGGAPSGSRGGGIGPTGGAPNPTLDQGAAKAAPFGSYANPTPTDSVTSNVGLLGPLFDENRMVDSYVYKKLSTGTPPAGPQVSTAKGNLTITATDGAKHTNFGGVYGHTLTASELGSNDLGIITAADPTGLLVATPVEGDPSVLSVREYKG